MGEAVEIGGCGATGWAHWTMGLDCNLMQWRIRPRGIGRRRRLELEPWRDGLGVGREEPCSCNYRRWRSDLVGGR
jgi:hypothetical protein